MHDDADEILASVEREAADLCYRGPMDDDKMRRLANLVATLAAVVRNERPKRP